MAQDIKVRNIQVEGIESPAPQPISGDDFISVNAKLRYTEGFILDNDYDLVYKSYVDANIAKKVYLTEADTGYVNITGSGVITIADWQTDFNEAIPGNFVRADIQVKQNNVWLDYSAIVPELTKNVGRELLTIAWYLNMDVSTYPIQAIDIRLM